MGQMLIVISAGILIGALFCSVIDRIDLRQICNGKSLTQRLFLTGLWLEQPLMIEASDEIMALRSALRMLYQENAEYIEQNSLGDVHHNRSMQRAKDLLEKE